jgi:hypothetical protein
MHPRPPVCETDFYNFSNPFLAQQRRGVLIRRSIQHPYFFFGTIASLAAFAIRIFTTVLAGILIA